MLLIVREITLIVRLIRYRLGITRRLVQLIFVNPAVEIIEVGLPQH